MSGARSRDEGDASAHPSPPTATQDVGAATPQTAPRDFRLRRSLCDRQPRDFTNYNIDGNAVSYAMVCGPRIFRSTATYRGDTFEGDLKTKAEDAAEVVSHVKARRLGACP